MIDSTTNSLGIARAEVARQTKAQIEIRGDFEAALEKKVNGFLNVPDDNRRAVLHKAYGEYMTDGKFDLDKIPEQAKRELAKLQKAAEDFEAHFIKDLMSHMRAVRFGDEDSPMTSFAKDTMDQAVAETTARGRGSIGIAQNVFMSMGDHVVRQVVGNVSAPKQTGTNE